MNIIYKTSIREENTIHTDFKLGYLMVSDIIFPLFLIALPILMLFLSLNSKHKKIDGKTVNKFFTIFVFVSLFVLGIICFVYEGIPLIKDIPCMYSHNFNTIDGDVLDIKKSSGKYQNTTITINNRSTKEQKIIKFSDITYKNIIIGENLKIDYLPNSLEGITCTLIN